jgi:hypothetical protein
MSEPRDELTDADIEEYELDDDYDDEVFDWQTCPSCGKKFDASDDAGLGFGGCPEGNCLACEKCCKCEPA